MKRIIITLALLAMLFAPQAAQAGTVRCRLPWQPVLVRTENGLTWTCMYIWRVQP